FNSIAGLIFTVPTGEVSQDRKLQFWATFGLNWTDYQQVFAGEPAAPDRFNTIRQWEELSYWFESLSIAAGNGPIATLQNQNFTSLSSSLSLGTTHSYMTGKPFYEVKSGFSAIKNTFRLPL